MARKSYDRMYREYDVKEYENKVEEPKEEPVKIKEEKIPEEKKEDVKEEKKPSFIGTVNGGSLNVRRNPNGDIVTSIKEGTQVVIVDESNPEWFKIESPEKGYVMKKFIRI